MFSCLSPRVSACFGGRAEACSDQEMGLNAVHKEKQFPCCLLQF